MLSQGLDTYTVAKKLNDQGVPTKSGGMWHPLTVKRMATNTAYIGITFFGRTRRVHGPKGEKPRLEQRSPEEWHLLPDVTPPIVSKELFDQAQKALQHPKLRPGRPLHDYLLTGHIVCGHCGTPLVGTCLSHRYRYYRCRGTYPTAIRPQICHAGYIKADILEEVVWGQVRQVLENPEIILAEVQKRKQTTNLASLRDEITQKRRQVQNYQNEERRLITLYRYGEIDDIDYILDQISRLKKIRQDAEERLSQLVQLEQQQANLQNAEIKLNEFCSTVRHNLDNCSFQEKRLALDALAIKITATPQHVGIEAALPIKFSSTEQTWA